VSEKSWTASVFRISLINHFNNRTIFINTHSNKPFRTSEDESHSNSLRNQSLWSAFWNWGCWSLSEAFLWVFSPTSYCFPHFVSRQPVRVCCSWKRSTRQTVSREPRIPRIWWIRSYRRSNHRLLGLLSLSEGRNLLFRIKKFLLLFEQSNLLSPSHHHSFEGISRISVLDVAQHIQALENFILSSPWEQWLFSNFHLIEVWPPNICPSISSITMNVIEKWIVLHGILQRLVGSQSAFGEMIEPLSARSSVFWCFSEDLTSANQFMGGAARKSSRRSLGSPWLADCKRPLTCSWDCNVHCGRSENATLRLQGSLLTEREISTPRFQRHWSWIQFATATR
jgi:hypothetical protein